VLGLSEINEYFNFVPDEDPAAALPILNQAQKCANLFP